MQIHQSGFDNPHVAAPIPLSTLETVEAFRVSLHTPEQFRQALDALDPFTRQFATPAWEMDEAPQEIDAAA
jgi:hypothetical protein